VALASLGRVRPQWGLGANDPLPDYDDGRLSVRPADYVATADGVVLHLKLRELGLLAALSNQPDRVVTREELLETVWRGADEVTSRAVDACVARLRAQLAAGLPDRRYIHTHARVGYRFSAELAETDTESTSSTVSTAAGSAAASPVSGSASNL
jgi:DNA-binding response OmpR family regulator